MADIDDNKLESLNKNDINSPIGFVNSDKEDQDKETLHEKQECDPQKSKEVVEVDKDIEIEEPCSDVNLEKQGESNEKCRVDEYVAPLDNPYEKAWKFLFKHDILTLFQGITANIVSTKPYEPIDFMIEEIEKLQEQDRIRKGVIRNDKTENKSPSS